MSKSQINLRGDTELKNKLNEIAKKKDTSLNEVSIQALTEFVENYELDLIKDDEIPSASQLLDLQRSKEEELLKECRNSVKKVINNMIDNGFTDVSFDPTSGQNLSIPLKRKVIDILTKELQSLGYATHTYISDCDDEISGIYWSKYSIAIATNEDDLRSYIDEENQFLHLHPEQLHG